MGNIGIKITTFTDPYPVIHEDGGEEAIAHVTPNGSKIGVIFLKNGSVRVYTRSEAWAEGYTPDLHRESYLIDADGNLSQIDPIINK